jgi:hypothetical protein
MKSKLRELRCAIMQRPACVSLAGCAAVLLTPFVFFPEIMGDAGVSDAGPVRNWTASAFLILGAISALAGLAIFARRVLQERRGSRAKAL